MEEMKEIKEEIKDAEKRLSVLIMVMGWTIAVMIVIANMTL